MKHAGRTLSCKVFNKQEKIQQGTIVDSKRLGAVLDYARQVREKMDGEGTTEAKGAPASCHTESTPRDINPVVMQSAGKVTERPLSPPTG